MLHLMCGVPGAGKTTRARELAALLPAVRLTPDEWLLQMDCDDVDRRQAVEALQWEIAVRILGLGVDVILENGFRTRSERDEFRARAAALGATTRIHFMDAPFEELVRRLTFRNAQKLPGNFEVTEEQLVFFVNDLEPPTQDELHVDRV